MPETQNPQGRSDVERDEDERDDERDDDVQDPDDQDPDDQASEPDDEGDVEPDDDGDDQPDDDEDSDEQDADDQDTDEEDADDKDSDKQDEDGDGGQDDEDQGHGRDHDRPGGQYQREEWEHGAAPNDDTVVEYQRRDADALFLSGAPCGDPNCQNLYNPAEDAWIKLVSPIPTAGQAAGFTVVTTGTAAPGQDVIRSLVDEVRPDDPDKYALRTISETWLQFKDEFDIDPGTGIAVNLKAALRTLSDTWKGDDFDAFAEQVEVVLSNCASICDDIGDSSTGAVGLLEQKSDEFFGLQGGDSGELPYPAPLYWISDAESMFTDPLVHVRPPFSNGDCQITAGCDNEGGLIGALLELGGFEKDYVDEVSDYVENQTRYYMNKHKKDDPPITEEQAAAWAQADANNNITGDINAGIEDYNSRSQIANEDVVNRWQNAEESAGTFTPEAKPSNPSNFREASDMLGDSYGGLDSGSNSLNAGDEPPGGGGSGAGAGGGSSGLEPPGGVSGGLASGGSTLGSGGGFPVGAASATGEGAAGNTGAGGGAKGGMGGGMMGGGGGGAKGGMGGEDGPAGEHSDWLEEDQEIWGIRDIDDDPYA